MSDRSSFPLQNTLQRAYSDDETTQGSSPPPTEDTSSDAPSERFPPASFAFVRRYHRGPPVTQVVAHRGYKARFPENTMLAFKEAIRAGADAIETDVRLSHDGVVVLSHDASLQRCYGIDLPVSSCTWREIQTGTAERRPKAPMPRLLDLLRYLDHPDRKNIWLNIDIKKDVDAERMITKLAETLSSCKPKRRPWTERILLGCWTPVQVAYVALKLPGYPISHISISTLTAAPLLSVPNLAFSMQINTLMGAQAMTFLPYLITTAFSYLFSPIRRWIGRDTPSTLDDSDAWQSSYPSRPSMGHSVIPFLQLAQYLHRPVSAWTVNSQTQAVWCFANRVDTIITDDVETMVELRNTWAAFVGSPDSPLGKLYSESAFFAILRALFVSWALHVGSIFYHTNLWLRHQSWTKFWAILQSLPRQTRDVKAVEMGYPISLPSGASDHNPAGSTFPLFGTRGGLYTLFVWWIGLLFHRTMSRSPDLIFVTTEPVAPVVDEAHTPHTGVHTRGESVPPGKTAVSGRGDLDQDQDHPVLVKKSGNV